MLQVNRRYLNIDILILYLNTISIFKYRLMTETLIFYEYPYLKNILKFFNYKKLKEPFLHVTKLSDNIECQIIFRKFIKKYEYVIN